MQSLLHKDSVFGEKVLKQVQPSDWRRADAPIKDTWLKSEVSGGSDIQVKTLSMSRS